MKSMKIITTIISAFPLLYEGMYLINISCTEKQATQSLHCDYWNRGHPDNVNQSQGRTETKDSNIFKSSQSNVGYRTMKSQLVCWPEMNKKKKNEKQPPNLNISPQSLYWLCLF